MVRINEDMSERLDIGPAEFSCSAMCAATQGEEPLPLMWACKCCQVLVQEPV